MNQANHISPLKYSFPRPLISGRFIRRVNRFVADVTIDGVCTPVHVPNTGRMKELLVAGREVWLLSQSGKHRKTRYDLILVFHEGHYVCVDSGEANRFVGHLINRFISGETVDLPNPAAAIWHAFSGITEVRREASLKNHRLDFRVQKKTGAMWIEVKSVNLVVTGCALFPDAPTVRGRHHLDLLRNQAAQGAEAHVVFVVQRSDAVSFSPNRREDPKFADRLLAAAAAGVGVHALGLDMTPTGAELTRVLPVKLD